MKKRRIMQVVYSMNRGGVETWLMHVLRNIDRSSFQIDFLTHTKLPSDYNEEITSLGSQIYSCRFSSNIWRYQNDLRRILITNGSYDVVHSHAPMFGAVMDVSKQIGVPARIVHSHSSQHYNLINPFKRFYLRHMLNLGVSSATKGLACSNIAADSYFGPSWQSDPRWRVFHCGEDFSPFRMTIDRAGIRSRLGLPVNAIIVGHVGSFRSPKNHAFIIRVAREVTRLNSSFKFLLIGDGVLRNAAMSKVEELRIGDYVTFAGTRGDVPQLMLGAMDLFLFPSRYEGLGLAAVEAQAAGLPCIFSDSVPTEAVVVPELVKFVSLKTPPEVWARIIIEHLNSSRSLSRQDALARVEASDFNIKNSLAHLEGIYSEK